MDLHVLGGRVARQPYCSSGGGVKLDEVSLCLRMGLLVLGGRVARQPYCSSGGGVKLDDVSAEDELELLEP